MSFLAKFGINDYLFPDLQAGRQPTGIYGVDTTNPSSRNLVLASYASINRSSGGAFLYDPLINNTANDWVDGSGGNMNLTPLTKDRGILWSGSGSNLYSTPSYIPLGATGTIAIKIQVLSTGFGANQGLADFQVAANNDLVQVGVFSSNKQIYLYNPSYGSISGSTSTVVAGGTYVAIAKFSNYNSTSCALWVNGVKIGTMNLNINGGNRHFNINGSSGIAVLGAYVWNRQISDAECVSICNDFWQLYSPPWLNFPFPYNPAVIYGRIDTTIGDIVNSANATLKNNASIGLTLGDIVINAAGNITILAHINITLDGISQSISGHIDNYGSIETTIQDITSQAVAIVGTFGNINLTLDDIASISNADLELQSQIDIVLDDILSSANAITSTSGSINITIDDIASIATGSIQLLGNIDITLGDIISTALAQIPIYATIDITMGGISSQSYARIGLYANPLENFIPLADYFNNQLENFIDL